MAEKVSNITKAPALSGVHILWITAGLGCDGDSVSVTAAEQPSIEDVLMGAIPGLPKVHLHNPVLSYEVGDDFMIHFYDAEAGRLLGGDGHRPQNRAAHHHLRMDRPPGPEIPRHHRHRHVRHLWRHSCH